MSFSNFFVLLGAIWSLINFVVGLLAASIVLTCGGAPDDCSDLALQAAAAWQNHYWWFILLFGVTTYVGFRTVWPDLRRISRQLRKQAR